MNRHSQTDVFGDTQPPHEVAVRCGGCGRSFTTDEDTARDANRQGRDLRCSRCQGDRRHPHSQADLEDPTVDAVHDELRREVGPDAQPPVEAVLGTLFGSASIADFEHINVGLRRGTESLGTVAVRPGDVDGVHLSVELDPSPAALSDEAVDAIVSTLSRHTQLLIEIDGR